MAAQGEFSFSVSDLADTNPYTIPIAATTYGGDFKVLSGDLAKSGLGNAGFYLTEPSTTNILKSRVEVGSVTYAYFGPAVVNSLGNGYFAAIRLVSGSTTIRVFRIDSGSRQASGDVIATAYRTMIPGDVVELTYDENDGELTVYVEGIELASKIDTTYNDTDMRPGYHVDMAGFSSGGAASWAAGDLVAAPDYTIRKGSTAVPITHTLTAGGITSQTFNGETVALASQSGQVANVDFTDTITTSGVYTLTLGDGVTTQNFDVQYNVIGLEGNTFQKDGISIGARTDLEMDILDATGATVLDALTGLTTDAAGDTGAAIVAAGAAGDSVRVSGYSDAAGIGFAYKTTLSLV